jgi:hypothetical protein
VLLSVPPVACKLLAPAVIGHWNSTCITFHSCNRTHQQQQQAGTKKAAKNFLSDRAEPQVCLRLRKVIKSVNEWRREKSLSISKSSPAIGLLLLSSFPPFPLRNVGSDGE